MSHQNKNIALAIVQALRDDPATKGLPFNGLLAMVEAFTNEVSQWGSTERVFRNAPRIPADNPPDATEYPDRESLKPTPLPVPDPEDTESATATKISIPDYGNAKRFSVAMGELADAASKLFEIASENSQEKSDARRVAFDWHNEVRSSIYDL